MILIFSIPCTYFLVWSILFDGCTSILRTTITCAACICPLCIVLLLAHDPSGLLHSGAASSLVKKAMTSFDHYYFFLPRSRVCCFPTATSTSATDLPSSTSFLIYTILLVNFLHLWLNHLFNSHNLSFHLNSLRAREISSPPAVRRSASHLSFSPSPFFSIILTALEYLCLCLFLLHKYISTGSFNI